MATFDELADQVFGPKPKTIDDLADQVFGAATPEAPQTTGPAFSSDAFATSPEQFGPPKPVYQLPVSDRLRVPEQFGPAAPTYRDFQSSTQDYQNALASYQAKEQEAIAQARAQADDYARRRNPSMRVLDPTAQEGFSRGEIAVSDPLRQREEMAGRISQLAAEDAIASTPLRKATKSLAPETEEEAVQQAKYQASLSQDPNWQRYYVAPEAAPQAPVRQFSNPQEQALYDSLYRRAKLKASEQADIAYYHDRDRVAAENAAYNTLGQRALRDVPVAREIASGLAQTGMSLGAVPIAAVDAVAGTDYSKDMSTIKQQMAGATRQSGSRDIIPERIRNSIAGATESIATSAIGGQYGKYGAIAAGALTGAANTFGEGQKAGLNRIDNIINSLVQGGIEGTIEAGASKLGLGGVEDIVSGAEKSALREGLAAHFTKTFGKEWITEAPTTELQNAAQVFLTGGRMGSNKLSDRLNAQIDTALTTGFTAAKASVVQRIVDQSEPPSRKQMEAMGFTGPTSLNERQAVQEYLRQNNAELQRRVEEQPELQQASPDQRVGAEFAAPIAERPRPVDQLSEQEADASIAQTGRDISKNYPNLQEKTPDLLEEPASPSGETIQAPAPNIESRVNELVGRGYTREKATEMAMGEMERTGQASPRIQQPDVDDPTSSGFVAEKRGDVDNRAAVDGIVEAIDNHYEATRKKGVPRDPLSELISDRDAILQEPVIRQAIERGHTVVAGDSDIANVGGINNALGNAGTDVHLKEVFKIIRSELGGIVNMRRGGDEGTHLAVDDQADADALNAKAERASQLIREYSDKTIVEIPKDLKDKDGNILLRKGDKVRLSDIPNPKGGPGGLGFYGVFSKYQGGDVKQFINDLSVAVANKKDEVKHGAAKTQAAGAGRVGPTVSREAGQDVAGKQVAPTAAGRQGPVPSQSAQEGVQSGQGGRNVGEEGRGVGDAPDGSPGKVYDLIRRDAPKANLKNKPQGAYWSINRPGFKSPHEDAGDVEYRSKLRPNRPLILSKTMVKHPRFKGSHADSVGEASSGVAALKILTNAQDFDRLLKSSKKQLIDELSRKFPGDSYESYNDSYELLEVYAAKLAKEKGYDALILRDKVLPDFDEFVDLGSPEYDSQGRADVDDRAEPQARAVGPQIPVNTKPDAKAGVEPINNLDIVENMRKRFNLPIRKGRIASKVAAAIYKKFPQVARSKVAGDLGPIIHEVAHHIDNVAGGDTKGLIYGLSDNSPVKASLGLLDYDQNKQRSYEGFAEFTRQYVAGLDQTATPAQKQAFDNVKRWFENTVLPKHPDLKTKLDETISEVERYKEQGAENRVKQSIKSGIKPKEAFSRILEKAYTGIISSGESIRKVSEKAYQKYLLANRMGGLEMARALEQGIRLPSNGEVVSKPFEHVMEPLRKDGGAISDEESKNWMAWVKARHSLEMLSKDIDPGITKADAQYVFDKGKSNKNWEEAANRLTEWNNQLLDVLVDAGLKTQQEVDIMRKAWSTYIPMNRVQEEFFSSGLGAKGLEPGDPIKRRKGGGENTLDPIQATFEKAVRIYDAAAKAAVINQMAAEAIPGWGGADPNKARPGLGQFIEQVPPNQAKKLVNIESIRDQLESYGVDTSAIPDDKLLEYWTPNLDEAKGERVISIVNPSTGKKSLLKLDNDLYEVVKGMDTQTAPMLIRGLATFGHLKRLGVTQLNPAQPIANFIKDYAGYLINTDQSWLSPKTWAGPFLNSMRYGVSEVLRAAGHKGLPDVRAWQEAGGEILIKVAKDRGEIQKKVRDVLASPQARQKYLIVNTPLEFVQKIIGFTETGPRLSEFKDSLKKQGYDPSDTDIPQAAMEEAIAKANDVTVNFGRSGSWSSWIRAIPYLNAGLQGADKMYRTVRDNPKRTLIRGAAMSAATAIYWLARYKDEDYEEQEDWLKYGFWTATDESGKVIARLPRAEGYGFFFSALPEAALNAAYKKNPKELVGSLEQLKKSIPAHEIPGLTGLVETQTNYDFFKGKPIVDQFMQDNLKREDWAKPWNTELSKQIAKLTGESPAMIEHLADDATGGMFSGVASFVEDKAGIKPKQGSDSPFLSRVTVKKESSKSLGNFYDKTREAQQEAGSLKAKGKASDELSDEARMMSRFKDAMGEMRKYIADERDRDKRLEVEKYMIGLARRVQGEEPLRRYPDPFTDENAPEKIKVVVGEIIGKLASEASDREKVKFTSRDRALGKDKDAKDAARKDSVADAVQELKSLGVDQAKAAKWLEWKLRQGGLSPGAIQKRKNTLTQNWR